MDSSTTTPTPATTAAPEESQSFLDTLQQGARTAIQSPMFWPIVAFIAGVSILFFPLLRTLPTLYGSDDGYYSHGWLIPLIVGYIIYRWWPKLKDRPAKRGYLALLFLVPFLYLTYLSTLLDNRLVMSGCFVVTILLGIWFVAGFRWMLGLSLPTLYLFFGLPIWTMAIDNYTNPLQVVSTKSAFHMLRIMGFDPLMSMNTVIYLPHGFVLDVGVPCSGLKLMLAVTAFTIFFIFIGNLKWWANLIMLGLIVPLCLAINGLRIALIGVVGDKYGSVAGHQFHDYSGYIVLILCFFLLFKVARWLGWKD